MRRPIARDQNQRKRAVGSQVSGWAKGYPIFDPSSLTGLQLWLDASDSSTVSASGSPLKVSQWDDKSGNGRHATQGTAAAQPSSGVDTQNALNVLTFDGNDNLLAGTASNWVFLHDGSVSTVWIVARAGNSPNPAAIYGLATTQSAVGGTSRGFSMYYADAFENDALAVVVANGSSGAVYGTSGNNAFPAQTWKRLRSITDPDNTTASLRLSISVNNNLETRNNTNSNSVSSLDPASTLAIGSTNNRLIGAIAEVIIVNGTLAPQQITNVESYLSTKWGI